MEHAVLIPWDEIDAEITNPFDTETLISRWIVPPFSVLDTKQGYWQKRKRQWLNLGIKGELGRGESITWGIDPDGVSTKDPGRAWTEKGNQKIRKIDPSPGGSPMPAADYSKRQRGDGRGRPLARAFSTDLMRGEDSRYAKGQPTINRAYRRPDGAGTAPSAMGTSIFDPVLTEIAYQWFCPPAGRVLDPFCGGSVRGVVAAKTGREYVGIDLSERQIEANRLQGQHIIGECTISEGLTPIHLHKGMYLKREDLFAVAGVRGAKARTCWHLSQGAKGLVTAGSRQSPQANIVAQIAKTLNIPCHVHTPQGQISAELIDAQVAGAEIIQHKPGYNSVIIARARADAEKLGWVNIPFGMECKDAVGQTAAQVRGIPKGVKRIVIPVGSGMNLAGLLHGLKTAGLTIPVFGVRVGADPTKRLDQYAPDGWRGMVDIVDCGIDYHKEIEGEINGIILDPVYEAKCLPYLKTGDLFWIIGVRRTLVSNKQTVPEWHIGDAADVKTIAPGEYDLLFTCPPYHDLELYSDDPRDLSNMSWDAFLDKYSTIIKDCADLLKENRFAVFVVSQVRDKKSGCINDLVGWTVQAFADAGL